MTRTPSHLRLIVACAVLLASLAVLTWAVWRMAVQRGDQVPPHVAVQPPPDAPLPELPPQRNEEEGEDWPCFLGPTHDSVSSETNLLRDWGADGPPLRWTYPKGAGYAAPAVADGRVVVFHREGDQACLDALDAASGMRAWRHAFPTSYKDRFGYNNGPRASPVIDGDRVFAIGPAGMLRCVKLDTGEVLWTRDLAGDYGLRQDFFGFSSTPLAEGAVLIVNVGAPKGPCVVGLDKASGEQAWAANGPAEGDGWGASYASPVPVTLHGRRRVLVFAGGESKPPSGGLLCLDPVTGRVDFGFPWRSQEYESVNATCPVALGEKIFVTASYGAGGALVEVLPDFSPRKVWESQELGSHFGVVIHRDGFLYGFDGRHDRDAELVCLDAATGRARWRQELTWEDALPAAKEGAPSRKVEMRAGRAALLWADGRFLCLGEHGHLLWLEATPDGCTVAARAWLFAAPESWTPPVLSRGRLYVMQNERDQTSGQGPCLRCYDLRERP